MRSTNKNLSDERKFWQDRLQEVENEMAKAELHRDTRRWSLEVRMCKKHLENRRRR